MRVFGDAPKAVVEWAEKHGFENVVYDMHIKDVPKEVTAQKTLYIRVKSNMSFQLRELLKLITVPIKLHTYTVSKPYRSEAYVMISDNEDGCFVIDIKTGSLILGGNSDIFERRWPELAQKLSMILNGYRALLTNELLARSLLNTVVRFEMPDEEELRRRMESMLELYEPVFQKKIEIEVTRRTAELEAENQQLKKRIEEVGEKLKDMNSQVMSMLKDILRTVARGWRVVEIGNRLFLYYPEEIKPDKIITADGVVRLPEDNPFFVRGILMEVSDEVSTAYAIKAFHPNVDPDPTYINSRKVYEICLGDLKWSKLTVATRTVLDLLKGINLLSAFSGRAEEKAEEIVEKLGVEKDWEV